MQDVCLTSAKTPPGDDTVILFGIPVSRLDQTSVLDRIFAMLEAGPESSGCRALATLNIDFVVNAVPGGGFAHHTKLWSILKRAALVTADGMPLVLLSKIIGAPIAERVTGADLVPAIAERAAATGRRLYFLGGTAESAAGAVAILTSRYPGLQIVGVDTPMVDAEPRDGTAERDKTICERINAARPDLLFIGFGNPKQELWLDRNRSQLRVAAAIGIGGTFNFICGNVKRAPRWMQRSGLEWIYRVIQEPRRLWKRYGIGLIKFGLLGSGVTAALLYGWLAELFCGTREIAAVRAGNNWQLDFRGVNRLTQSHCRAIWYYENTAAREGGIIEVVNLSLSAHFQLWAFRLLPERRAGRG